MSAEIHGFSGHGTQKPLGGEEHAEDRGTGAMGAWGTVRFLGKRTERTKVRSGAQKHVFVRSLGPTARRS